MGTSRGRPREIEFRIVKARVRTVIRFLLRICVVDDEVVVEPRIKKTMKRGMKHLLSGSLRIVENGRRRGRPGVDQASGATGRSLDYVAGEFQNVFNKK